MVEMVVLAMLALGGLFLFASSWLQARRLRSAAEIDDEIRRDASRSLRDPRRLLR